MDDLIRTIEDSDEEVQDLYVESSDEEEAQMQQRAQRRRGGKNKDGAVNPSFEFGEGADLTRAWSFAEVRRAAAAEEERKLLRAAVSSRSNLTERLIAETRAKRDAAKGDDDAESESESESEKDSEEEASSADNDSDEEGSAEEDSDEEAEEDSDEEAEEDSAEEAEEDSEEEAEEDSEEEDSEEEEDEVKTRVRKGRAREDPHKDYFERLDTKDGSLASNFMSLHLSRPLLRAVQQLGFKEPTPVQAATIPVTLRGRDVVANAVTGSGKTAAFALPVLERLWHRRRGAAATRVLVLAPTRELAAQVHSMIQRLGAFTDIRAALVIGGIGLKAQESALRSRPDIIVATPGRIIDHVRNTASVSLDDLEILIMDEADRLLELGFTDEVHEIVRMCPRQRQTMLFSATMTDEVDQLIKLSLNTPVRVSVDGSYDVASRLTQEFIRIRSKENADREAVLCALATRTFKTNTIVFFPTKRECHRCKLLFGLAGLKAAELHGNLTQVQRLAALDEFREGDVDFLLCTDLAARGLDIAGVDTVINFSMPNSVKTYIHRVGRTARAGRKGVAVCLVGEENRPVLRKVVKKAAETKSRKVPPAVYEQWRARIRDLEADVESILRREREDAELRIAEMEVHKAQNMLRHRSAILSRPAKTWFQTAAEKKEASRRGAAAAAEGDRDGTSAAASAAATAAAVAEVQHGRSKAAKAHPKRESRKRRRERKLHGRDGAEEVRALMAKGKALHKRKRAEVAAVERKVAAKQRRANPKKARHRDRDKGDAQRGAQAKKARKKGKRKHKRH